MILHAVSLPLPQCFLGEGLIRGVMPRMIPSPNTSPLGSRIHAAARLAARLCGAALRPAGCASRDAYESAFASLMCACVVTLSLCVILSTQKCFDAFGIAAASFSSQSRGSLHVGSSAWPKSAQRTVTFVLLSLWASGCERQFLNGMLLDHLASLSYAAARREHCMILRKALHPSPTSWPHRSSSHRPWFIDISYSNRLPFAFVDAAILWPQD